MSVEYLNTSRNIIFNRNILILINILLNFEFFSSNLMGLVYLVLSAEMCLVN